MAGCGCEACGVASSVAKRCKAEGNNKLLPLLCGKLQGKIVLFHTESVQAKFQVATFISDGP